MSSFSFQAVLCPYAACWEATTSGVICDFPWDMFSVGCTSVCCCPLISRQCVLSPISCLPYTPLPLQGAVLLEWPLELPVLPAGAPENLSYQVLHEFGKVKTIFFLFFVQTCFLTVELFAVSRQYKFQFPVCIWRLHLPPWLWLCFQEGNQCFFLFSHYRCAPDWRWHWLRPITTALFPVKWNLSHVVWDLSGFSTPKRA